MLRVRDVTGSVCVQDPLPTRLDNRAVISIHSCGILTDNARHCDEEASQ